MIQKALQYIISLGEAKTEIINGDIYSDKPLHRIDVYYPKADAIKMTTLSSLVDYIKSNVDTMSEKMIIQVVSPEKVRLISQLDDNRERESLAITSTSDSRSLLSSSCEINLTFSGLTTWIIIFSDIVSTFDLM